MTLMLACVTSPDEAETAIAGGCDLLDLLDPEAGATGWPGVEMVREVVAAIDGRRPAWAAAGGESWRPADIRARAEVLIDAGADAVKIALDSGAHWAEIVEAVAPLSGSARLIAVLFADRQDDPDMLVKAAGSGFAGAILDIAGKGQGRLLDHAGSADLARFVGACKERGLLSGFAGSLEAPDVPRLLALDPSLLGFRSALCRGHDRNGVLEARSIEAIRGLIPGWPAEGDAAGTSSKAAAKEAIGPVDRIYVRDLEVPAFVGAYRGERDKPQRLRFEVVADVRRLVAADDDLRNIVSYDLIIDAIERLVGLGHVDLLETLAERLAEEMLRYDQVLRLSVKIEKPDVERGTVGVEIVRSRLEDTV